MLKIFHEKKPNYLIYQASNETKKALSTQN